MKRNITNGFVILSFLSGAVGGLIYETHKTLSIALIAAGLIGAIYVYISSDNKQNKSDEFQGMTAKLLFGAGIENPYTKLVEDKLAKGGTHKDVLTQLDKALEIAPNDADALALYARIAAFDLSFRHLIAPNDTTAASTSYRKTMAITERGISTGRRLSQFYSAKGVLLDTVSRYHEARSWYGEAAKLRSDPYWRLLSSTSYGMEKDYLNALDQVEKAIEEGAKGSGVDFYYGRCLAAIGENDRALALFQNVRQRRGYFYELIISMQDSYWFSWHPIKSSYYELLAALYIVQRSKRKALRHIVSAARKFGIPLMILTYLVLETIAKRLPLLSHTKMANLCDPGNPHVSLGLSLMKTENVQAAKKMFAIAVHRSPRFNSWMNYCSASIMTGDWEEAQRAYLYLYENWPDEIPEGYATVISERVLQTTFAIDNDKVK